MNSSNLKRICVFCGARPGVNQKYKEMAAKLGEMLAKLNLELVYGGSNYGLMAEVSNATLRNNGSVLGVYPKILQDKEPLSAELTNFVYVDSMHTRKDVMISNSDAFVVLPGGVGTLDELFEVLTLKILGNHNKPVVLINQDGYWDKMIDMCQFLVEENFAGLALLDSMKSVSSLDECFKFLGFNV